jgi:hypothetical protein
MLKKILTTVICFIVFFSCSLFSVYAGNETNSCLSEMRIGFKNCDDLHSILSEKTACQSNEIDIFKDCIFDLPFNLYFANRIQFNTSGHPCEPIAYAYSFVIGSRQEKYYLTILNGGGINDKVRDLKVKLNGTTIIHWGQFTSKIDLYEIEINPLLGRNVIYIETNFPVKNGYVTILISDTQLKP